MPSYKLGEIMNWKLSDVADEIEENGDIIGYIAETLASFRLNSPTGRPTPTHYQMARQLLNKFDIKVKLTDMSQFKKSDIVIDNLGSMWVRRFTDENNNPELDEWSLVWIGWDDSETNVMVDGDENLTVTDDWLARRKLKLLVRDGQSVGAGGV